MHLSSVLKVTQKVNKVNGGSCRRRDVLWHVDELCTVPLEPDFWQKHAWEDVYSINNYLQLFASVLPAVWYRRSGSCQEVNLVQLARRKVTHGLLDEGAGPSDGDIVVSKARVQVAPYATLLGNQRARLFLRLCPFVDGDKRCCICCCICQINALLGEKRGIGGRAFARY